MKKRMWMLTILLAGCLAGTSPVWAETEQEATETQENVEGNTVVTKFDAAETEVLVCYPKGSAVETSPVKLTCTAPVLLIYGDGYMTEADAASYIETSGLGKLAQENGSTICVVNPKNGESWSEEDKDSYVSVMNSFDDSSTADVEAGIVHGSDWQTGEPTESISATRQRVLGYGIGSGADFMVQTGLVGKVTTVNEWGVENNFSMSGCTLIGLSDVSGLENTDVPVVSVSNSEEINNTLQGKCEEFLAEDDFQSGFDNLLCKYRRHMGVLIPFHDYESEGIVEKIETVTVKTSEDNASEAYAGTEEHDIDYVTYYGDDLDVENGNVPLVLCFHGGGNTALYEAQATEWPEIGKENGFITVSVDHHPDCSATEIVELIDMLEEEYSIDSSRIYASGFSMGGVKSWDLFEQYPEKFAGLAPMDATNDVGVDTFDNSVENHNADVLVPIFYVAGEQTYLPELPYQEQKVVNRIQDLFKVNGVVTPYDCDFEKQEEWTNPLWGIDGDMVYKVTDKNYFTNSVLTVNMFASEDGKYYTAYAGSSDQMHEIYARNSWAAWDFLKQFSRNEDGSIEISDVSYTLPSDDNGVTGNEYNK